MEERKQAFVLFGYRFFYVFLLCGLFYAMFGETFSFRDMVLLHLFVLAVLSAGVSAVDSLKGRNYLYGFIAFLVVYAVIVLGLGTQTEDGLVSTGRVFLRELLYLMLIALGIYLCHLLAEKFVWIKWAAAILFLGGLVLSMVFQWRISHLCVAAVLLYVAAVLTEYIESGWKKQKQGSGAKHQGSGAAYLLYLLPFLLGYFLLTALMPYKDTPYDWAVFVRLYGRMQEKVITLTENLVHFGNEDFGISTTGFSDESGFFGNLDKKDKTVFVIDNPYHYAGSVYLTGKNYESFDGRKWEQRAQSGKSGENDGYLDALQTLLAVYDYDREYPRDYLRERILGVEYRYFHTKYLFAPLKTRKVEMADAKTEYGQQEGGFLFSKKQGYGTKYRVTYYQLNQANPVFEELVSASGKTSEQQFYHQAAFDRAVEEFPALWKKVSPQDLADYQNRVKRDYVEKVNCSPEVELFLQEVTAEAGTDYERLLCLEKALSELAYNERPGRLPKDVDTPEEFLDYFLVDSREGYCSYFASAFVLLARRMGIPARYVQGFCVSLDGRRGVEVKDSMAHAWPEAWFDGIGWVAFEPTPGFYGQSKASWETRRKEVVEAEESAEEAAVQGNAGAQSGNVAEETEDLEAQLREEERQRRRELMGFLGYFLGLLFVLGVLLLAADALLERRRAKKRTQEEAFRLEALRNLQILSVLGYRRQASETLSELSDRMKKDCIGKSEDGVSLGGEATPKNTKALEIEDFVAVCEEVLYGGRFPDEDGLAQMRITRERLFDELRKEKGRAYVLSRIGLYLTRVR